MSNQVPPPAGGYPPYGQQGPYGAPQEYPTAQTGYQQAPNGQAPYGQAPYGQAPYAPYQGVPYPGAPQGGSGMKIVVIVAVAVIAVGAIIGGLVYAIRSGSNQAGSPPSTSANANKGGSTPTDTPSQTPSETPSQTSTPAPSSTSLDYDESQELAKAAFPLRPGNTIDFCIDSRAAELDAVYGISCFTKNNDHYVVFVWDDQDAAMAALRGGSTYKRYDERRWTDGLEFYHDGSGIYYETIRCYSTAPVCIQVWEDTRALGDVILGKVKYLDSAGIVALNTRLTKGNV